MKLLLVFAAIVALVLGEADLLSDSAEGTWENSVIELHATAGEDLGDDQLLNEKIAQLAARQGRNFVENGIKNLLESFREVVINGNDDLPPLDPLRIDHVGPYRYNAITGVRSTVNLQNLNMEGLRWYTVDQVSYGLLSMRLRLQITIPRITLRTRYTVRTRLALLIVHNAAGNINVDLNRLAVAVNTRMGTSIFGGGQLFMRELDIKITIDSSRIRITGMTGSSLVNAFISGLVNRLSDGVIDSTLLDISEKLSEELLDVINDFLRENSIMDIIG